MTTKPHKKSNFEWLKSIVGWQKSVFISVVTAFTLWVIVYAIDHVSSPADVKKINVVQADLKSKISKDSLFGLRIEEKINNINFKTALTDQKLNEMLEEQKVHKDILIKILFAIGGVKKQVDYNKTYSTK